MVAFRLIAESGLRGRGGAGFPVEAKVRAVRAVRGKAVVVANGAAGDPLGEKDAFLLSRLPHLVLDGAQVAAEAVEARQMMVHVVERPARVRRGGAGAGRAAPGPARRGADEARRRAPTGT